MRINQDAPVKQTQQITIAARPEKVWKILANIEQWDTWNERIKNPILQGNLCTGSTFTWKSNGSKIKSTIHLLEPNRAIGWTGKAIGAKAIHNWYLEPQGNKTVVKVEESMDGWVIKLLKNKMNEILKDDITQWLKQLKKESEK